MDGGEFAQHLNPFGCASCRYRRKRCEQDCEYRKYFPMSKFVEFKNARKLFGMINIVRLLNSVEARKRSATAESILQEGKLWVDDPANGGYGIVKNLQAEIDKCEKELEITNNLIQACKEGNLMQFGGIGFHFSDVPIMLPPDCNTNIHITSVTFNDVAVRAEANEDTSGIQVPLNDQNSTSSDHRAPLDAPTPTSPHKL